jgi:hypothetical protein
MNARQQFIAAAGESIKVAYEVLNLTVPQIAEQQELSEGEVKSILWAVSMKFKKDFGGAVQEEDEITQLYTDLARCSPVDAVREKALRFLMNEKRGRNDIPLELLKLKKRSQAVEEVDLSMRLSQFNAEIEKVRANLEIEMTPQIS